MAQFAAIGIHAIKPIIDNSDTIWEKGRERIQKYRRRSMRVIDDEPSSRPRGGQYAAAASGGGGAYYGSRARSTGDYYSDYDSEDDRYYRNRGGGRGRSSRKYDDRSYYDSAYESEGSVPPVNRRSQSVRTGGSAPSTRARGGASQQQQQDWDSEDDSSSSTSVMDSEEDEKMEKKKRRSELLTGGIAAVATLHAAANVYGSMKARQEREKGLAEGTITREQAKRSRYKHHMQDAASIGLAALSIKGAYGKWQGAHELHKDRKQHRRDRKERHQRRLEKGISRSNRASSQGPYNGRGLPAPQGYEQQQGQQGYGNNAVATRPAYNRTYSRSAEDLDAYERRDRRPRKAYTVDDFDPNGDYARYDSRNA